MRRRKCPPGARCKPPPKDPYRNVTKTVREWVAVYAARHWLEVAEANAAMALRILEHLKERTTTC